MEDGEGNAIEETAEVMQRSLKELRSRLSGEASFSCPMDDTFLLMFLRARKYNVKAAGENVRKYFKVRKDTPEIFDGYLPSNILYDDIFRKHKLIAASRQRDASGRAVLLFRMGSWESTVCSVDEVIRASLMLVEWAILDEEVQKRGIVFVLDYAGLGLHHLIHLTPFVMKKLVYITEKCLPVRVKAIYVINDSVVFDTLFAITKPFLSGKLVQRIHLLGYDVSKLLDVVPADIVSELYGGTFETYDFDKLERDLLSKNNYFKELSQYGYGKENTHV